MTSTAGENPACRSAAGVRQAREARLRKRARLTHHGGLLHDLFRRLAVQNAA